jgi:hemolysin activation/secretion protein
LAGRFAFGGIRGSNIPFTEMFDQWSSSEAAGIPVLGGSRSLRGYREYRFTGMVYGWGNLELRSRFFQTNILRQHLAFSVVPFYDIGTVWDSLSEVRFGNFRMSPGLGARIAWNQATILRFDLAMSPEDTQFFFVFGHTF